MLDHPAGAPVHRNKRDQRLVGHSIRSPVPVRLQDEFGPGINHAVTGGDHVDGRLLQPVEVFADLGPEGHHDFGVIALGRLIAAEFIGKDRIALGQMGAEKIAAEENPVLGQIGEHRLRPVHPGRQDELQRFPAKPQDASLADGQETVFRYGKQIDQQRLAFFVGHDSGFGIHVQNIGNGAGMILLGVMGDDVVDPRDPQVPQMPDQIGGFRRVDRIDQGGLLPPPDQVRIVRGAVGKGNQLIKQPAVPVDGPDGEYILLDFSGRHLPSLLARTGRTDRDRIGTGRLNRSTRTRPCLPRRSGKPMSREYHQRKFRARSRNRDLRSSGS